MTTPADAAILHALMSTLVGQGPQSLAALLAVAQTRVPWASLERVERAVAALELVGWATAALDPDAGLRVAATHAGRIALARSAEAVPA